ncbi:MAG: hypothetical protein E6I72_01525 [Chloroflexi bacterium]|nr:MAG: hypothetical protein E6I72_01525 [Chloroflexota bacterium]
MRLLIAGGGTGGHLYPALAVARAFRVEQPDGAVLLVGREGGPEERLVPAAGFELETVRPRRGSGAFLMCCTRRTFAPAWRRGTSPPRRRPCARPCPERRKGFPARFSREFRSARSSSHARPRCLRAGFSSPGAARARAGSTRRSGRRWARCARGSRRSSTSPASRAPRA